MNLKSQFDLAASQMLSRNSRKTYWLWALAFYRFGQ